MHSSGPKSFQSYFQSAYSKAGQAKKKRPFFSKFRIGTKSSFPKLQAPNRSFIPARMNRLHPNHSSHSPGISTKRPGSKTGPGFKLNLRWLRPISLIGLPFALLFISVSLYLHPLFTETTTDARGNAKTLLIPPPADSPETDLLKFLSSESSNRIAAADIAELTDENGNDLDLQTLNPYKAGPSRENPVELAKIFSTHRVESGDTIWNIARKNKIGVDAILSFNKFNPSKKLRPGETIKIPKLNGIYYSVRKNDSLESISRAFSTPLPEIRKYNDIGEYLSVGTVLFLNEARYSAADREGLLGMSFMSPVRGFLTSRYGMRLHPILNIPIFHTGMDIGADQGEKVKAAADGVVIFSGDSAANGNFIEVRHNDGYETGYAHLSKLLVPAGKRVKKGEVIGEVGSTGLSTGPHLHFEIKQNGKFVNPGRFVNYDTKPLVAKR